MVNSQGFAKSDAERKYLTVILLQY
jgi:hypothetical protein